MSSFSSILSSLDRQPKLPDQSANAQRPATTGRQNGTNGTQLKPNNAAAGVKRRSEEPEDGSRLKATKTAGATAAAPPSRFQLSSKPNTAPNTAAVLHRPSPARNGSSNVQSSVVKSASKAGVGFEAPAPAQPAPVKRGFASIMERAKAAQTAAAASGPSTIKHKAAEKLTKRERRKLADEAQAQEKAAKAAHTAKVNGSNHGQKPAGIQKGHEISYKGTMKKAPEPLSYKGTMRAADATGGTTNKKQNAQAQDKYGGYASWSDLDEAEDEEEDYDSEGSSDMEGGFDDVEREEVSAMRAGRKEDQEFLEEEERLKREKLERKRKLLELSKSAAARKKY